MTVTKGDIVSGAYAQLRISGLTINASNEDVIAALDVLEDMAAEFEESSICLNWVFEDNPDPSTESGVQRSFIGSLKSILAWRMAQFFGKQIPPSLEVLQRKSMSLLSARTAKVRQTQYPRTMPRGSGNTLRYNRWQRFYRQPERAPISCATHTITYGGILDFSEDFNYWLNGEAVQSFTITPTGHLTIQSSSESSGVISYRVKCDDRADEYEFLEVEITSDTGRIQTFRIDFNTVEDTTNG